MLIFAFMLACATEVPTFGPALHSSDELCVDDEVAVAAPSAALYQAESSRDGDDMVIHAPLPVARTDGGVLVVDCQGSPRAIVNWIE